MAYTRKQLAREAWELMVRISSTTRDDDMDKAVRILDRAVRRALRREAQNPSGQLTHDAWGLVAKVDVATSMYDRKIRILDRAVRRALRREALTIL